MRKLCMKGEPVGRVSLCIFCAFSRARSCACAWCDFVCVCACVHACLCFCMCMTIRFLSRWLQVDCEFAPLYVSILGVKKIVSIVRAFPVEVNEGEKEVNRSHEMLRHSPIMTVLFSMQGEVIQSNVAASYYYTNNDGQKTMTLQDMVSTCRWDEGVTPEQLVRKLKRMKLGDQPVKAQVMKMAAGDEDVLPRDNAENQVWHEVQFIPTTDPVTGSPALLLIESDISELEHMKAVEAQLLEAHKQKEAFFAAISHELRTPLNGIIGLTESMIDDDDLNESAQHTLGIILKSATRLNVLINDILDASSLKQGTLKIRLGPVDVNEAIDQVCEHMKILSQSDVELIKLNDPKIPLARGDHQRIFQILTNLLGNSLKFTHKGHVKIWSDYDESLDVIKLNIEDTGIGIPSDKIESVFKPFSQGDMSTTRSYEGTGLGLALVQSLVAGHGGDIFVESEVNMGTTFSFTLHRWSDDEVMKSSSSSSGRTGSVGLSDSDDEELTVTLRMEGGPDKLDKSFRRKRKGKSHDLDGDKAEVKRGEFTIKAGGQGAKGKESKAVAPGSKSQQQGSQTTSKVSNIPVDNSESRGSPVSGVLPSPMPVNTVSQSPMGLSSIVSPMCGERNATTISKSRDLEAQNLKLLIEVDELRAELQEYKQMKFSNNSDKTTTRSSAGEIHLSCILADTRSFFFTVSLTSKRKFCHQGSTGNFVVWRKESECNVDSRRLFLLRQAICRAISRLEAGRAVMQAPRSPPEEHPTVLWIPQISILTSRDRMLT